MHSWEIAIVVYASVGMLVAARVREIMSATVQLRVEQSGMSRGQALFCFVFAMAAVLLLWPLAVMGHVLLIAGEASDDADLED